MSNVLEPLLQGKGMGGRCWVWRRRMMGRWWCRGGSGVCAIRWRMRLAVAGAKSRAARRSQERNVKEEEAEDEVKEDGQTTPAPFIRHPPGRDHASNPIPSFANQVMVGGNAVYRSARKMMCRTLLAVEGDGCLVSESGMPGSSGRRRSEKGEWRRGCSVESESSAFSCSEDGIMALASCRWTPCQVVIQFTCSLCVPLYSDNILPCAAAKGWRD